LRKGKIHTHRYQRKTDVSERLQEEVENYLAANPGSSPVAPTI